VRWFSLPRGVLAAEWIKLRTLRSTYCTAVISAVAALGLGAFDLGNLVADWDGLSAERQAAFDPVRFGFSGGYYVVVLALGTIVRHSAGAIAALFGLFFVAPMLTEAAGDAVERGTLQPAFQALSSTTGPVDPSRPSTAAACVVCVVWLAVALAVAAWSVERRDV
jgi:hypothetical protein